MTYEKQVELKKQCNRDANYPKQWRQLEDKFSHNMADFQLEKRGWESTKRDSWQED